VADPGIGFGKTLRHNLRLLAGLRHLRRLGVPLLVGASRKSFIGRLTGDPPERRLEGSLAAAVIAASCGADLLRVHDVAATVRALRVVDAVRAEGRRG
jgi:dihydropteroate synthase